MGAELSEHSWVQFPERQEVKIGASAFHGFYLKTWDYIILFNLFTCQPCPHWQSPEWSIHCLISVLLANFPMKYNTYQYFMNSSELFKFWNIKKLQDYAKKEIKKKLTFHLAFWTEISLNLWEGVGCPSSRISHRCGTSRTERRLSQVLFHQTAKWRRWLLSERAVGTLTAGMFRLFHCEANVHFTPKGRLQCCSREFGITFNQNLTPEPTCNHPYTTPPTHIRPLHFGLVWDEAPGQLMQ